MKVEIAQAREICKIVKENFPYESPWKQYQINYKDLLNSRKDKQLSRDIVELRKEISKNEKKLEALRNCYQFYTQNPFKYFMELVNSMQIYHTRNCGETARLGYLVSRINGIKDKNVTINSLTAQTLYSEKDEENILPIVDKILAPFFAMEYGADFNLIDHVVTKIRGHKENFLIDPLLEEVGPTSKMEKIYTTKYGDIFNIETDERIRFTDYPTPPYPILPRITDEEAKALGKNFQFLVLEENKNKINDAKKHFIGLLQK